jgi:glc operon protein GlcG
VGLKPVGTIPPWLMSLIIGRPLVQYLVTSCRDALVSYRPELLPHPHQVLAMRARYGEDSCVDECDSARRWQVQHGRLITLGTRAEGLAMRPTMSAELSRRVTDAAMAEAAAMAVAVTVVTVDESGVLKELRRMDGAPLISVQTAVSKAYAAAAIGMPPDEFYKAIESDGAAVASFATRPGLALIGGGMPVVADGLVAGAVGVAGAMTAAEDRQIAEAAIDRARR